MFVIYIILCSSELNLNIISIWSDFYSICTHFNTTLQKLSDNISHAIKNPKTNDNLRIKRYKETNEMLEKLKITCKHSNESNIAQNLLENYLNLIYYDGDSTHPLNFSGIKGNQHVILYSKDKYYKIYDILSTFKISSVDFVGNIQQNALYIYGCNISNNIKYLELKGFNKINIIGNAFEINNIYSDTILNVTGDFIVKKVTTYHWNHGIKNFTDVEMILLANNINIYNDISKGVIKSYQIDPNIFDELNITLIEKIKSPIKLLLKIASPSREEENTVFLSTIKPFHNFGFRFVDGAQNWTSVKKGDFQMVIAVPEIYGEIVQTSSIPSNVDYKIIFIEKTSSKESNLEIIIAIVIGSVVIIVAIIFLLCTFCR